MAITGVDTTIHTQPSLILIASTVSISGGLLLAGTLTVTILILCKACKAFSKLKTPFCVW